MRKRMNGFPANDGLAVPQPPTTPPATTTRRDIANRTAHYADEFQVYHKSKTNGNGTSKRASCLHCNGDWAYNETRLKNHIIDPYRGCRKIPSETRERIRLAHARAAQGNAAAAAAAALAHAGQASGMQAQAQVQVHTQTQAHAQAQPQAQMGDIVVPAAKRKRESVLDGALLPGAQASDPGGTGLRVGVEFSLNNAMGGLLRAQWIASELVHEFHRQLVFITLQPNSGDDNVFNIWINGKVVWSRGPGTAMPDYEHIRPLIRAAASQTHS